MVFLEELLAIVKKHPYCLTCFCMDLGVLPEPRGLGFEVFHGQAIWTRFLNSMT